ncbi:site-specific DNA-methyltransferase [Cellvibrio japonicus]|nr:site-specific DNA-methyltransferase [Cellvibrio japonicus]QEI13854.1 site-specific DNA-methyltransferase [Cellvibrio japonicus]QEI17428.1 site-specific DNA-methyltransferase [Cellvibrio japonicus]QEI21004.1 site-specific DNA-methyltransferase [Cellvibrio japonicus]
MAKKPTTSKTIAALTHTDAKRKNIPTAEYQSVVAKSDQAPTKVSYPRQYTELLYQAAAFHDLGKASPEFQTKLNRDLDPQLLWRGKDVQDWSDLVVNAPPIYLQEKVHPKVLIDDLKRRSEQSAQPQAGDMGDLFADFNGIPQDADKTEFYQHDGHWQNRMILGDSLQVMASLAEREQLRGKVQCIYFDPPYGIKFNSNFQWSTTSRDVKDGNASHITREPEQVKAFRDTWRDGIHSYLTYLRDRLTVARDLLTESGSIFVQIGDENVHRVRAVMDEVFGEENFIVSIVAQKTTGAGSPGELKALPGVADHLIWYARKAEVLKYRQLLREKIAGAAGGSLYTQVEEATGLRRPISKDERAGVPVPFGARIFGIDNLMSSSGVDKTRYPVFIGGREFRPTSGVWKTGESGMAKLLAASRVHAGSGKNLGYVRYLDDFPAYPYNNVWTDAVGQNQFGGDKIYVVQTANKLIERCVLMTTDPGDLVLDPTCGSGTTAYVAEQWGRRWITIDTSRVALALARARIMGARYPFYLLADSKEGQQKEAEITRTAPSSKPTYGNIRHGFVYERVPHITLKSIANNAEIDVIWEKFEQSLQPLREQLTQHLPDAWLAAYRKAQKYTAEVPAEIQEWEIPRDFPNDWPQAAKTLHEQFWQLRIQRQQDIDSSIAAKADYEYLYDKPYEDKKKVRVAGPFTVESLSPHRMLQVDENDELIDPYKKLSEPGAGYGPGYDFAQMILENLKTAGVQQAHKADKIDFTSLQPWPGEYICAEGRYQEQDGKERRAAIFVGPEFGTVSRVDLVTAAREAADADFDVLIACAFNYEAHTTEFEKLGRIPVLKARMNADLHMAEDLKNTGKGNLFVIFGEPDIDILKTDGEQYQVKVKGVDVFHPNTGEVRSDGPDGIACWFIDTDYNEESFFVRHAYFLGASDPYKSLKTTLKAEINEDAWATLNSDTSRPFEKPKSGRIAVKIINHLGDEVMKVFRVG